MYRRIRRVFEIQHHGFGDHSAPPLPSVRVLWRVKDCCAFSIPIDSSRVHKWLEYGLGMEKPMSCLTPGELLIFSEARTFHHWKAEEKLHLTICPAWPLSVHSLGWQMPMACSAADTLMELPVTHRAWEADLPTRRHGLPQTCPCQLSLTSSSHDLMKHHENWWNVDVKKT